MQSSAKNVAAYEGDSNGYKFLCHHPNHLLSICRYINASKLRMNIAGNRMLIEAGQDDRRRRLQSLKNPCGNTWSHLEVTYAMPTGIKRHKVIARVRKPQLVQYKTNPIIVESELVCQTDQQRSDLVEINQEVALGIDVTVCHENDAGLNTGYHGELNKYMFVSRSDSQLRKIAGPMFSYADRSQQP